MDQFVIQILLIIKKYLYEIFLSLTLVVAYVSYTFNDSVSTLFCLVFCIFLMAMNRFEDNLFLQRFIAKWL